jgi:hypothetical protein
MEEEGRVWKKRVRTEAIIPNATEKRSMSHTCKKGKMLSQNQKVQRSTMDRVIVALSIERRFCYLTCLVHYLTLSFSIDLVHERYAILQFTPFVTRIYSNV